MPNVYDSDYYKDFYAKHREKILEYKRTKYKTRDNLIMENIRLQNQIDDLNKRLLTAVENRRYLKPVSEIVDIQINSGNFVVDFE